MEQIGVFAIEAHWDAVKHMFVKKRDNAAAVTPYADPNSKFAGNPECNHDGLQFSSEG
jgi:hypothetical protein